MQILESVEKFQNLLLFYIFWDILNKIKNNLCQKCVKERHLSLQSKFETIAPGFLGKMMVFSSFSLLFHLSLPKIWFSHPHKNYIFGMSNNRAFYWKRLIMISLEL